MSIVRVPKVPCNEEVDFSLRIVKYIMILERKYLTTINNLIYSCLDYLW